MKATSVKKSDLIIATSLLCEMCYHRDEQCEPLKISYFKKLGWRRIGNEVVCPKCVAKLTPNYPD